MRNATFLNIVQICVSPLTSQLCSNCSVLSLANSVLIYSKLLPKKLQCTLHSIWGYLLQSSLLYSTLSHKFEPFLQSVISISASSSQNTSIPCSYFIFMYSGLECASDERVQSSIQLSPQEYSFYCLFANV